MCWLSAFALDDKSKERRDIPLKEVSRRSLLKRKKCRRLSRERRRLSVILPRAGLSMRDPTADTFLLLQSKP